MRLLHQRKTHRSSVCSPWLREPDLNRRPPGYGPGELPTALSRDGFFCAPTITEIGLSVKEEEGSHVLWSCQNHEDSL